MPLSPISPAFLLQIGSNASQNFSHYIYSRLRAEFSAALLGLQSGAGSVKRTERFTKALSNGCQLARRTFALDTESEAEDFDPPEDGRKSTSGDELSSSDNENSAPDDEESDLGQEWRRRQRIPWQLV